MSDTSESYTVQENTEIFLLHASGFSERQIQNFTVQTDHFCIIPAHAPSTNINTLCVLLLQNATIQSSELVRCTAQHRLNR